MMTKFYSEDGSFEVVRIPSTGQEKHILYIAGTPYESNIVYLKEYEQESGSYKYLHKDYLGSILAITDEEGNKIEGRHYDAWGNFTHLKRGNGPVVTDKAILVATNLLIDRGYTSHEHFMQVGIIHMNGRLYDPLLRRFLNADENIQDPSNTQNYNKYGYVMNNPLMYSDPDGEFWWMAIGAIVGGYLNGVHANNGNWNPGKWDWKNNWGAVLGGAIGGASIAGALGNITSNPGAIKNILPNIVSGGLNSAFSGSNFLSGMISGISYSANVFNNTVTSTDRINYAEGSTLNQKYNSGTSTTIGKNLLAGFLVANGIMPYDPATLESLNKIISLFSSVGDWIKIGDAVTVADFSKGYLNYTINPTTKYLELYINGRSDTQAWGVTNPINGKIILSL